MGWYVWEICKGSWGRRILEIAFLLRGVGSIEKQHNKRYNELLEALEANKIFEKEETMEWRCQNCGHVHKGTNAPEVCPICKHPKAFFEVKCDEF